MKINKYDYIKIAGLLLVHTKYPTLGWSNIWSSAPNTSPNPNHPRNGSSQCSDCSYVATFLPRCQLSSDFDTEPCPTIFHMGGKLCTASYRTTTVAVLHHAHFAFETTCWYVAKRKSSFQTHMTIHRYSKNWFGHRFKTETSWNHFLSYLQFSAWLISQWMVLANPAMHQELQGLWLNRSPVRKRIATLCWGSGWIATTQKSE